MLVCKKGYQVQLLKCPMGYYLGTVDPEIGPNCRISSGYACTAEEVCALRPDREGAAENLFCSGGSGCCFKEVPSR